MMIEGLRRQERNAQEQVLNEYGSRVFATISCIVSRQEDAEEVYQDVFMKAFLHIDTYDETKASFANWLCRIAYHESLNFVRGHKQPVIFIDDGDYMGKEQLNHENDHLFLQTDEQTIQIIEKALQQLSNEEQALITMFYFDDMSIKEIAYITDSQPSTIGSRLCRIRQKLYNIIKHIQE